MRLLTSATTQQLFAVFCLYLAVTPSLQQAAAEGPDDYPVPNKVKQGVGETGGYDPNAPPPMQSDSDKVDAEADDEASIMAEWEEHMSDFVPADMITFECHARSSFIFYEDITVVPTYIRGAYFVSHTANSDISFRIIGPRSKTLFIRNGKKEGIFYFVADKIGEYVFEFQNQKYMEKK